MRAPSCVTCGHGEADHVADGEDSPFDCWADMGAGDDEPLYCACERYAPNYPQAFFDGLAWAVIAMGPPVANWVDGCPCDECEERNRRRVAPVGAWWAWAVPAIVELAGRA